MGARRIPVRILSQVVGLLLILGLPAGLSGSAAANSAPSVPRVWIDSPLDGAVIAAEAAVPVIAHANDGNPVKLLVDGHPAATSKPGGMDGRLALVTFTAPLAPGQHELEIDWLGEKSSVHTIFVVTPPAGSNSSGPVTTASGGSSSVGSSTSTPSDSPESSVSTEPATTAPTTTTPNITPANTIQPDTTQPDTTQPDTTQPDTTQPDSSTPSTLPGGPVLTPVTTPTTPVLSTRPTFILTPTTPGPSIILHLRPMISIDNRSLVAGDGCGISVATVTVTGAGLIDGTVSVTDSAGKVQVEIPLSGTSPTMTAAVNAVTVSDPAKLTLTLHVVADVDTEAGVVHLDGGYLTVLRRNCVH